MRRRWLNVSFSVAFACISAAPVLAQNALDANTAVGSSGRNSGVASGLNFRARNSLVTGNVVGGRGFQGTVGYTAASDFRGELGSNDFYMFRAGSAFSASALIATGRTFEQLRYGQQLGLLEYQREMTGATLGSLRGQSVLPRRMMIENRIRLDQYAASATSGRLIEAATQPDVVGLLSDADGRTVAATASSLRGMQLEPVEIQYQMLGLTSFDMARVLEDMRAGRQIKPLGTEFDARFQDLPMSDLRVDPGLTEDRVDAQPDQLRIEPATDLGYQKVLQRIAERYARRNNADVDVQLSLLEQLDERFAELREQLMEAEAAAPPPGTPEMADKDDEPNSLLLDEDALNLNLRALMPSLRHGERLKKLASQDRTRFNELLGDAEQRLRAGEYFWAERRFRRALRFVPGHPLATAGMAHAQVGAGLYVPAALTLRRLLAGHPEMIDVQYDQSLMPNRVRLRSAISVLRDRLQEQRDRGLHAFLLAYIGHQIDDRDLVEAGLAVMGEVDNDDPLLSVLREVWLSPPIAPTTPPEK